MPADFLSLLPSIFPSPLAEATGRVRQGVFKFFILSKKRQSHKPLFLSAAYKKNKQKNAIRAHPKSVPRYTSFLQKLRRMSQIIRTPIIRTLKKTTPENNSSDVVFFYKGDVLKFVLKVHTKHIGVAVIFHIHITRRRTQGAAVCEEQVCIT